MELKITKEKVLEAAAKCSQAKETLKTLFPEVFDEGIDLIDKKGINGRNLFLKDGDADSSMIAVRDREAFYLSNSFNWTIRNYDRYQTLIPTKK